MTARPYPPESLLDWEHPAFRNGGFVPEPLFGPWVQATFIDEKGPLHNEDHAHLAEAEIAAVWTNADNSRRGRTIVGTAELCPPMLSAGKWTKARLDHQLGEWFEDYPDFLITLSAPFCAESDDVTFAALVEHELAHCGQEHDRFGMPKFTREGKPKFCMRGHDFEGFVGVAARYGAVEPGVRELMEVLSKPPQIAQVQIDLACGNCTRSAA